ncbi:RASL1 protein, partial [Upupa epops]|nr:RASL1 protein [Upupa epops]
SGSSDPYCLVKVDDEVVARTATVWQSLDPFWGEEYTLRLTPGFRGLSIYVLDEDTIGQDDVIGKVWLSHQRMAAEPRGIEGWFSLAPVRPDEEVQGEIHLELRVSQQGHPRVLRCHLLGASPRPLPLCPPTCQVEFCLDAIGSEPTEGWFQLLPFPSASRDHGVQLGALRLALRLQEDTVLPAHCYQPLVQLLTEPVLSPAEPPAGSVLAILEEVASGESRQDVATKLVKIFLGQGLAVPLLDYLTTRELARTTDPNTLFRSNSLASKTVEQFLKAVGLPYLREVLRPVVTRIFEEKKYVELDPGRMELSRGRRVSLRGSPSAAQVRDSSLELLKGYLGAIVEAIVGSVGKCPLPVRVVFKQLRRRAEERFPSAQHEEVRYFCISGFLFLRFFAPAVLTPKLFGLWEEHAGPRTG